MEKSCDTCMVKKRGECFGDRKTCASYKHCPQVSSSEMDNWPVIMRSNSLSRHLEWKKEQRVRSQRAKNYNTDREKYPTPKAYYSRTNKNVPVAKKSKIALSSKSVRESIESIRKTYIDSVIVWMDIRKTLSGQHIGFYLMEYQGNCICDRIASSSNMDDCINSIIYTVVGRMVKTGFEIVFVSAVDIEKTSIRNKINELLKERKLKCRYKTCRYLRKEISELIHSQVSV